MLTLMKGTSMVTFSVTIEWCLVPILQPFNGTNSRSMVVTDNASIHHVDKVVTIIQATGAILRFLLDGPDYDPLEESLCKDEGFS